MLQINLQSKIAFPPGRALRLLPLLAIASCLQLYGQETLFTNSARPLVTTDPDQSAVELGVRFQSAVPGSITAIRFFKGPLNTGTHTGSIWDASGKLLAKAQFVNETAFGWQTVVLASPVQIAANTPYIASYLAPNGRYSTSNDFFKSAETKSGNLTAPRNTTQTPNGVYRYGTTGGFPTATYNSTNYWVDVVFTAASANPPTNPAPTPAVISTLWPASVSPSTPASSDSKAVELGVKFRANVAGKINGVRFFKASGNGGMHIARLWSKEGSLLATANFVNETPTGWQQANFATAVSIDANKVYIATYHAPQGRYSFDIDAFTKARTNGPLTALRDGEDGGNGVYRYGNGGVFPTDTFRSGNYWVDVAFEAAPSTGTPGTGATPPAPTTLPPTISSQPMSQTVMAGAMVKFSVQHGGTPPFTYQWQKSMANIPGATGSSFSTTAVAMDNGAKYRVIVTNGAGSVTSAEAVLTVNPSGPVITQQPISLTVNSGETATFSVLASGSNMLAYQWQRNGVNIPSATSANYTTPTTQASDSGTKFRVVVSAGSTKVTSNEVTLTVKVTPPSITTQPANVTVSAGSKTQFTVAAKGSAPFKYEWRKNNVAIDNSDNATYAIASAAIADNNANFTVVVSNSAGSVTSSAAKLTVTSLGSTTTLSANPVSIQPNGTTTLTAKVVLSGASPAIATGEVEFLLGGTLLATVALNAKGEASTTWKSPATSGFPQFQARYKGTAAATGSTSIPLEVQVLSNVPASDRPPTKEEAVRFLSQATFGPTMADVNKLMDMGYTKWLDEQFGPMTDPTYISTILKIWSAPDKRAQEPHHKFDQAAWYTNAVAGKNQLRTRMEWALSQIFVVGHDNDTAFRLNYGDILRKNAFGNYRQLMDDITWSPHMGNMLTYQGNFWTQASPYQPDQNYAREIMQLFSIGLFELNLDGTRVLKNGLPVETYTYNDIVGLSHVFTGLNTNGNANDPDPNLYTTLYKMISYAPGYRSQVEKKFLGTTIPCCKDQKADPEIKIALDTIAAHPNVAPFLSKQLIMRFVTSNPSPKYVERVAKVWNNNGFGVKGDLKAVLRAILMDPDARDPKLAQTPEFGKVRESVLRVAQFYRMMNPKMPLGFLFSGCHCTAVENDWVSAMTDQVPYNSPTVFNFYKPTFAPSGSALDKAGLVAPELQVMDTQKVMEWSRFVVDNIGRDGTGFIYRYGEPNPYDWTEWLAIAPDSSALVARINLLMFAGQMTDATKSAINISLTAIPQSNNNSVATLKQKIRTALTIAFVAPDYIVQR
jgi:uncharacterized protein (DUF1800 family)